MLGSPRDTFWALDFDRCLGDVDKIFELYSSIVRRYTSITESDMIAARQEIEATGGSFNLLSYVTAQLDSAVLLKRITDEFIRIGQTNQLLHEGAHELIRSLETDPAVFFGIITYGSLEWQMLKLQATRLESYPVYIAPYPEKGQTIATWYDGSRFAIPDELGGGVAQDFVLVDDKAKAFHGLPEVARGYWVVPGDALPSQIGEVPGHIQRVPSLRGIVDERNVLLTNNQ